MARRLSEGRPILADRLGLIAALGLVAATAFVVAVGATVDVFGRQFSPEGVVRRYFAAVEASDPQAALAEIVPSARDRVASFVEHNLGNRYRVLGIATEGASVVDRLGGADGRARSVTVFLEITQKDGARWEAGPRVPLIRVGDRIYLGRPPLMPE